MIDEWLHTNCQGAFLKPVSEMETNPSAQPIPDMPPELAGPLPRKVRPPDSSRYGGIAIAVTLGLSVVLILWLCKGAVHQMQQRSTLRRAGADAPGEIAGIETFPRSQDMVSYTFRVNGRTFSGKVGVPARVERNLRESGTFMIRYLPSDPAINHPAAWEWALSSFLLGMIPLGILMSLLILFPVLGYRKRQLLAQGDPAVAVVTRCIPGKACFSLKYEFRTKAGDAHKGSGWSPIRREIGASIWILHMPQNPSRNLPYPFSDYRVEQ